MSIEPGTRLGSYEISDPLGAGGMGEVYRARDTRMGRDVAIKVLPAEFAADPDRLHRFEQEARAVAALNHPNILALFDIGAHEGAPYIVTELLEGESLRERLKDGAMPVRKASETAVRIAHGLAAAHDKGIVHRDLKPENVFLTSDGHVKILDFGLAKVGGPMPADSGKTLTTPPEGATGPGVVLGTVGYMSPEQVRGVPADARSDIFSFGAVFYEMLSGQRAFQRDSSVETMSAILKEEPPDHFDGGRQIPAALDRILRHCLEKKPEQRFHAARDVAFALDALSDASSTPSGDNAGVSRKALLGRRNLHPRALALAAVAALAGLAFGFAVLRPSPRASSPIYASLQTPGGVFLDSIALSPDGRTLAFTAGKAGAQPDLWIRTLGSPAAQPVAGAEAASFPFWSPDGRFIAYFSQGSLRKVDPSGGPSLVVCAAERGVGGAWNRDGTIVFAPTPTSALFRVPASGGKPEPVTRLDASLHITAHRYPSFLPDGQHFLYMAANLSAGTVDPANSIRVGSLDGKADKALVNAIASNPLFVAGHLLYTSEGSLLALRMDLGRLEVKGDPIPVAQRLSTSDWYGYVQFTASEDLLFSIPAFALPSQLAWFDRTGRPAGLVGEPGLYASPRLSSDARKIAVGVFDLGRNTSDIWLYDVVAGTGTRFVSGNANNLSPVWAPAGDRLIFASDRKSKGSRPDLWTKALDGSAEEIFLESLDNRIPEDWSPDGRFLSVDTVPAQGKRNNQLWIAETTRGRDVHPFATDANSQGNSRFSPDGRWLAYDSDESGSFEVYVRAFPGPGGRWQVSTAGGAQPHWRRDGKELYYITPENKIMSVSISSSSGFHAGPPSLLFATHPSLNGPAYDVTGDGQRFLVNTVPDEQVSPPLSLLVHWTSLLTKNERSHR